MESEYKTIPEPVKENFRQLSPKVTCCLSARFFSFCNAFLSSLILEDIQHALVKKRNVRLQVKKHLNPDNSHSGVLLDFNKKSLQPVVNRFLFASLLYCLIGNKERRITLNCFSEIGNYSRECPFSQSLNIKAESIKWRYIIICELR